MPAADFNDLDLYEHDETPLAPDGWPTLAEYDLHEGECCGP